MSEESVKEEPKPTETDAQRKKRIKAEYKALKKKPSGLRTAKFVFVALLVGIVLGATGLFALQKYAPTDSANSEVTISVVFDRVTQQNELVTASQKYTAVEKVRDANTFFDLFEIPFTENSFWYRYAGTIKAAVDLSQAKLLGQDGNVIRISLPQPYISSNTPDMELSGALEENNNILNPIHIVDVDEYRKKCVEVIEQEAMNGDLFEQARSNAAENLSNLFSIALGAEYVVEIEWI